MIIKLTCDKQSSKIQLLRINLHLPHHFQTENKDREDTTVSITGTSDMVIRSLK